MARRDYNEQVRQYNTLIVRFPANLVAGLFAKKARPFFEADADKQTAPKVSF